jgi:hypothetical protein
MRGDACGLAPAAPDQLPSLILGVSTEKADLGDAQTHNDFIVLVDDTPKPVPCRGSKIEPVHAKGRIVRAVGCDGKAPHRNPGQLIIRILDANCARRHPSCHPCDLHASRAAGMTITEIVSGIPAYEGFVIVLRLRGERRPIERVLRRLFLRLTACEAQVARRIPPIDA